jgi:hypothetical protein
MVIDLRIYKQLKDAGFKIIFNKDKIKMIVRIKNDN